MKSRYLLIQKAEAALIEESRETLWYYRLLDSYLAGDFETLVDRESRCQKGLDDKGKITILQEALGPFADMVASSYRGVGVGYYSEGPEGHCGLWA